MEKQTKEKEKESPQLFVPIPIPILVPITPRELKQMMKRLWPAEYKESLTHLQNARIEVLKAVDAAIKQRIETLEEQKSQTETRKEKVRVE